MKLLQLNAWTIRLEKRVIEMINAEAPDVINLQEVMEWEGNLGLFARMSQVADRTRYHHEFFSPVYGFEFVDRHAEWGNGMLSNLAFHETSTVFTNGEYIEHMSFERDDYNIRNFQHVVVHDQNDQLVHIINHHGYHIPEHKKGNDFTLKACQQIADYVSQLEGPVIITGDFNLEPTSESIAVLDAAFRNLTTEYGLTTTRTELTHKQEACDYIFVNDKVEVNDFYASKIVASDHQGLILDFSLQYPR